MSAVPIRRWVHYLKVQPESPEFVSGYDGIDQNIEIERSAFIFSASPRPVIALYDFIMASFAFNHNALPSDAVTPMSETSAGGVVDVDFNLAANIIYAIFPSARPTLGRIGSRCIREKVALPNIREQQLALYSSAL